MKKSVERFDFSRIDAARVTETPQGFLRVSGNLTRIGVLPYHRADGTVQRELREPAEVFRADSLATMRMIPVTDLHGGMVGPANVQALQVGITGENIGHDERFVTGSAIIQRADAIAAVKARTRCELSPGYRCWVDMRPGEWNGQKYDGIQRDIVYNHLAIGPKNWGRSGPDVALRMDGLSADAAFSEYEDDRFSIQVPAQIEQPKGAEMKKIKIVLDGVEYTLELAEALAGNFEQAIAKAQARADKVDGLEGELAAAKKATTDVQTELDTATDPKAIQATVAKRAKLVEDCKRVAPKLKLDEGLTDKDLKIAALVAAGTDSREFVDKTDGFIDGMFAGAVSAAPETKTDGGDDDIDGHPVTHTRTIAAAPTLDTDHTDAGDKTKPGTVEHTDASYLKMVERNRGMAAGPLDATRPGTFSA